MSAFSPCAACGKPCCANYTVSIVGVDAWLIGKHLFLPLESFLIMFPASDHNEAGFMLAPGEQRYEIALDKLGRYQKGNPCIFWISLQEGYGRCGIYPYRPLVCQTYPAYQQEEVVALRDDVYCPDRSWNLMGLDMPLFRRRLYRFRMEQDLYAYAVQAWNRAVEHSAVSRSLSHYCAFLMNLYARLDRVRQSIPAESLQQLQTHWGQKSAGAPNPLVADLTPRTANPEWQRLLANLRDTIDGYSASWRQSERLQSRAAA